MGVAKGLKVPCLFMITEVSIHCQKNLEVGIRRIPAYTPQYTTGVNPNPSPALAYGRRRLCTICTCKQNKHNATTPLASSQLHQARLCRLARLSSLARLCRLARLSSLARLLLVFWPVDEDVRTAGPVLALFTLPVLVCKHVNQVARQWVTLLDEPARLIGTVLATYKPTANHRLHN